MKTLHVGLDDRSYPIYIGGGLLEQGALIRQHVPSQQVVVVTNETVGPLYADQVAQSLSDKEYLSVVLPDGEKYKTVESAMKIWDELVRRRFSRNATLIALGGGVIGDLAGFAAAGYQRGIPFIQVPTTLLAQVDSSVGGKTAVNHPHGKNMIGAFFQPRCVIADTRTLRTLPDRELRAGLAEVIKYGLIRDVKFFEWLETKVEAILQRNPSVLDYVIERSCSDKAEVVMADEREAGVRATLNLGHTFGHAIETGAGYGTYLHGEAVAIGMCQAADLSRRLGWLSHSECRRIIDLIQRAQLPVKPPAELSSERFLELMAVDKKNLDGTLRLILLKGIGAATLPTPVDTDTLKRTLDEYGR